ncbi:unnamed protein product [Thelazia callipaeda]|uniref:Orotidine 5'-phosphate decarboxylase n=1 Tax=Thelazia callipaeda TaxID=103827 RepID=A0A0N5D9W2_THECL|nr:unnamed protein product [Thelazia callipaeda]
MSQAAGDMVNERLLIEKLESVGVFKLGSFTLKSGQITPIYIDLRVIFTSPEVLEFTAKCVCDVIEMRDLKYDYIVGVPYAALPLSTGIYEPGKRALIIEDVVTSGGSILETVVSLRNEGLVCDEAICVLDREQGGPAYLLAEGTTLYSLLNMNKILDFLIDVGTITRKKKEDILYQLTLPPPLTIENVDYNGEWSLKSRRDSTQNPFNKKMFDIMNRKKTCLCLAIDSTDCNQILQILEKTGDYICAVKLHADVIENFTPDFVQKLVAMADSGDFIIMEDRKFADIGHTVNLQLTKGPFKIASWAQVVTVHALSGQSVLNIIRKVINGSTTKLVSSLLVVELSSEGAFTNSNEYLKAALDLAKNNGDIVSGFMCQKRCANIPGFLHWTAGVHMDAVSDGIGQNWRTIEKAISGDGNDIVVVGRAVTDVPDINTQIRRYRDAAWEAFISRQQKHC